VQKAGSPKFPDDQLAINQDVAHCGFVDELISRERAERLDDLRPARGRKLSDDQRQRMKNKADRIAELQFELQSINPTHSASNAAALLKKKALFSVVSERTLRGDIAEIRKQLAGAINK